MNVWGNESYKCYILMVEKVCNFIKTTFKINQ
jgi:hypothetical protein